MDFMRWLSSLDELLFEVMSWLIFLPVTLWRAIRHPIVTMEYAVSELDRPQDEQYQDGLSPPIFLVLCLLTAHGVELSLGSANSIIGSHHGLAALVTDDRSLLLMRILLFGIFPLVMATSAIRMKKEPLNRSTLKPFFYVQCYPTAPFALAVSVGATVALLHAPAAHYGGLSLVVIALITYWTVQARWSSNEFSQSLIRATGHAAMCIAESMILIVMLGFLIVH